MTDKSLSQPIGKPDWAGAMIGSPRFEFDARLCTATDQMRLIAKHLPTCTVAELLISSTGNSDLEAAHVELCEKLVAVMLAEGAVDYGKTRFAKMLRCEYANRLIEVISSYGRCFFYSRKNDRVARLSFEQCVVLHDESGTMIVAKAIGKWRGFSHGGTLRDLVLQMRNYVIRGERIDPAYIGIDCQIGGGNIWGYPPDHMRLCREAAQRLPIINVASRLECAA